MRLLVDTHVFLWALTDSPRLSIRARDLLLDASNEVFFSAASIWEIAIKRTLKRTEMPISSELAINLLNSAGYLELGISAMHSARVETLPSIHSDPFDRLLVAQALVEPMHLVTSDRAVAAYSDSIILV